MKHGTSRITKQPRTRTQAVALGALGLVIALVLIPLTAIWAVDTVAPWIKQR